MPPVGGSEQDGQKTPQLIYAQKQASVLQQCELGGHSCLIHLSLRKDCKITTICVNLFIKTKCQVVAISMQFSLSLVS